MALDSVTLSTNIGTGSELAADTMAGGERVAYSKLIDGTAASETPVYVANGVHGNALRVTIASDSTGQVALAAGAAVIGEVSIGAATTATGDLAKAEDGAHVSGDVGVMALAVRKATAANLSGTDGDFEPLQVSGGFLRALSTGDIAHDGADSGSPVKIGAKAKNTDGTDGGVVAENDRTDLYADRNGRLFTSSTHPRGFSVTVDYAASAQTNATIKTAPGSGVSLYITDISISNGPSAVNNVKLLDGSGGSALFEAYFAVNSNCVSNLRQPIKLTANTLLAVTSTGATEMSINISGYIAE